MTVSNNVGLDNSWTADLVRKIDKRTSEGGLGNYVVGMGESALVVVASLVDAVKHAVFMAPYSLLTGNIGTSFWHGTRAVTHVIQAPLALPAILIPRIAVATAGMLQITARWEEQPAPADWKEKAITFAKDGLEKVRNIPHALLAAKIAGGAAVAGAAGTVAHQYGFLAPVYNLFGYGGEPTIPTTTPTPTPSPTPTPEQLVEAAKNWLDKGLEFVTPAYDQAQQASADYTGMGLGTIAGGLLGAAALYNVRKPSTLLNGLKQAGPLVNKRAGPRVFKSWGGMYTACKNGVLSYKTLIGVTLTAATATAQYFGIHNNTVATAGITAFTASSIVRNIQ